MKILKVAILFAIIAAILAVSGLSGVSAASYYSYPEVYSHEDGETVSAEENLTLRFDRVTNAKYYFARVKVLAGKPDGGNNEKALSQDYDFFFERVTSRRIKLYSSDLEGAGGHWLKCYIEARTKNGGFISSSIRYLYIERESTEFVSPWEYGSIPCVTVRKGSTGSSIRFLRQAINIVLGEDVLDISSRFDNEVQARLAEAQSALGIEADGVFGPASRKAFLRYLEQNGYGAENSEYNASLAIEYARTYNGVHPGTAYNSAYPKNTGNDCANFVSQCLVNAGLAITEEFNPDTSAWKTCRYSATNKTDGLMTYLESLGYKVYGYDTFTKNGGRITYPVDINKIKPGDVIFSSGSNGTIAGHAMIVDHVSGNRVYFHGHTNNRCGCYSCANSIHINSIQSHVAMQERSK